MDLEALIAQVHALLASNPVAFATLQAIFIVTFLDAFFGIAHAVKAGVFKREWLDAWVGDHLFKATMITAGILFGYFIPPISIGTVSLSVVMVTAIAAGATYVLKTLPSVIQNLNFNDDKKAAEPPASLTVAK